MMSMHQIDLSRVDLNLLVVFEALMLERHVGRAAKRLSLSQSAASHALGRLRVLFEDPLFVRNPRGIEPTSRGRELDPLIADALAQMRAVLSPKASFDPAKLRRTFTVATHDYAMAVLMPSLIADLRQQAPAVDLRCVSIPPGKVLEGLDRGELDFALGGFVGVHAERISRTHLFADEFVGVARRHHPLLRNDHMTLDDFVSVPHVVMAPMGADRGDIDQALARHGVERRVAVTTPSFLALPFIVEKADVIGVLPKRLAWRVSEAGRLILFKLPIEVEPVTCSVLVPAPLSAQPETLWFIDLLRRAGTLDSQNSEG
jgi:DNA-binding transcriptional LysR family regulator